MIAVARDSKRIDFIHKAFVRCILVHPLVFTELLSVSRVGLFDKKKLVRLESDKLKMAVSISDEDFQRLQNSLIDLKNENYNLQEKNRKQAKGAFIISIFLFSRHHIFYPVRSIFSSC